MHPALKFFVRAAIGMAGAYFLLKVFLRSDSIGWWLVLAALLVFLGYFLEGTRKDKN